MSEGIFGKNADLAQRLGTTAWSSEQFTEHDIGKTVFLTKEAAEAALEGGGAWQQ